MPLDLARPCSRGHVEDSTRHACPGSGALGMHPARGGIPRNCRTPRRLIALPDRRPQQYALTRPRPAGRSISSSGGDIAAAPDKTGGPEDSEKLQNTAEKPQLSRQRRGGRWRTRTPPLARQKRGKLAKRRQKRRTLRPRRPTWQTWPGAWPPCRPTCGRRWQRPLDRSRIVERREAR
jgi:hypothetical protein